MPRHELSVSTGYFYALLLFLDLVFYYFTFSQGTTNIISRGHCKLKATVSAYASQYLRVLEYQACKGLLQYGSVWTNSTEWVVENT